jgi:hypothetical protein
MQPWWLRVGLAYLLVAGAVVLTGEGIRWAKGRHDRATGTPSSSGQQGPPSGPPVAAEGSPKNGTDDRKAKPGSPDIALSPSGPGSVSHHKTKPIQVHPQTTTPATPEPKQSQNAILGCDTSTTGLEGCKDIEIRNNHFGGMNSVFQNAGKADRIFIADNTVQPSPGGSGTIVNNLPGGEISDLTVEKSRVLNSAWWLQIADAVTDHATDKEKIQEIFSQVRNSVKKRGRHFQSWSGGTTSKS